MTIEYLGIGTPEDALRSCLKLFSRLFEVPEAEVCGYLDMYFQLRLRVEESGGQQIAQTSSECRTLPARQNARNDGDDGGRQIAQASSECRTLPARQDAPTEKTEVDPPPAAPSIAKKPRPGCEGNDYAKKAAVFKREVREKLAAARAAGITSGMIMEKVKPGSALTQGKLLDILNARLAPVEAYRVLDEVLDTLEAASKE